MSLVLPSTSLSPAWSSSSPPGRRNLMPNNLLVLRSGSQRGGGRSDSSNTKMPSVSSRRVIPKNQDLPPSPGLPRTHGLMSSNGLEPNNNNNGMHGGSTGNLNATMQTRQHPQHHHQHHQHRHATNNLSGSGLFHTTNNTTTTTTSNTTTSMSFKEKPGKFPQFDDRRPDRLRNMQDESTVHNDTKSSHTPPNNSKPSFIRSRNVEQHSNPQKQESFHSSTRSHAHAHSHSSSKSLSHSSGHNGSVISKKLKQREDVTIPKDPRVKFDPKLTTLGSHSHAVSASIPTDDRVQLRIAVEELRLIVKWREQQQQELQKRVGKLAGKYNKLLDLYISEKDRAESAFAKLQKQLRELRAKDIESTKIFNEKDNEIQQKTNEINHLKESLELEKRKYEQETHRLNNHIDTISSKLKAQTKEFKEKENTGISISKLTDSAFCRWQSYGGGVDAMNQDNGANTKNLFQPVRPPKNPTRRSVNSTRKKTTKKLLKPVAKKMDKEMGKEMESIGDEEDVRSQRRRRRSKNESVDRTNTTDSDMEDEDSMDAEDAEEEEDDDDDAGSEKSDNENNEKKGRYKSRNNGVGNGGSNGGGVDILISQRHSKRTTHHKYNSRLKSDELSAPQTPVPNVLLDQMALSVELIKCELLWSQKQVIELQKKLKIKNMKIEEKKNERTLNIRDTKDVVDEGVAVEEEEDEDEDEEEEEEGEQEEEEGEEREEQEQEGRLGE